MVSSSYVGLQALHFLLPRNFVKGAVIESGVAVAGRTVRVYERSTGKLLNSTVTNSKGLFYMDVDCDDHVYVIAFPIVTGRNAEIYDYILPANLSGMKEI